MKEDIQVDCMLWLCVRDHGVPRDNHRRRNRGQVVTVHSLPLVVPGIYHILLTGKKSVEVSFSPQVAWDVHATSSLSGF